MLSADEALLVASVRTFVNAEVRPVVRALEHADEYPAKLIDQMKLMGVFGLAVPEQYGGTQVSTRCYVAVTEELARGWMSLAGAMGGHTVVCKLIADFGTDEQKERYLARLATGELRSTIALSEASGGSDLQGMSTNARRENGGYLLNGAKMWVTNSRRSGLLLVLCKTDPQARPAHSGMSVLLVEQGPGVTVSKNISKLGYRGVETCEVVFEDCELDPSAVLGAVEGQGFRQMMRGLEIGRLQVAARALGVAQAALDDSLGYAQQRQTFGRPIWQHQSISNYLADMATKLSAARQLTFHAADSYDSGKRSDLEAGMAKLFSSEVAMEITLNAMRIHGGYGYSTEFDIERYFRDAPLMIIGEGTNEIQRNVITAQLVKRAAG